MLYRLFSISLFFPAILIAFENDDLEKEIQKAKEVYAQDVEKARTVLLEKLEFQIKKFAKTGNLELVQKLVTDKKEFEANDSRIPVSAEFKSDVSEYQQKIKKGKDSLIGSYAKGIKEYTKKLELDKAMVLKLEMDQFSNAKKSDEVNEKEDLKKNDKEIKGFYSIHLFGAKDRYIHHANFLCQVGRFTGESDASNEVATKNATFEIVQGISRFSKKDHVSFRSYNWPDYYISCEGFQVKIKKSQNFDSFKNSATFKKFKGLSDERGISFELINSPKYFLRSKNGLLVIDKFDGTKKFRDDSTFNFSEPLFNP